MKQPLERIAVLIVTMVVACTAYATEPSDWSGWYAGIFGGYQDGKLTTNDPSHFETTGEFDDNSPIFGIQGGINKSLQNGWIIGGSLSFLSTCKMVVQLILCSSQRLIRR